MFVSGDGADKAFVWKIVADMKLTDEQMKAMQENAEEEEIKEEMKEDPKVEFGTEIVAELTGHTETVEFTRFDSSGKWIATGGMNNLLRIWDVQNGFALKQTLTCIPQEDILFLEWHSSAPLIIAGGKDYMIWLVHAINNKVMASFAGHEDEITLA